MYYDGMQAYTLHLSLPSLSGSVCDWPLSLRIFLMHSSRTIESNRPLIFPRPLTGNPFFPKIVLNISVYASIHSWMSISRRPNMIAIILAKLDKTSELIKVEETYPPVLVPPIKSKTSHGLTVGLPSFTLSAFTFAISALRMRSVESPRTPPPSFFGCY